MMSPLTVGVVLPLAGCLIAGWIFRISSTVPRWVDACRLGVPARMRTMGLFVGFAWLTAWLYAVLSRQFPDFGLWLCHALIVTFLLSVALIDLRYAVVPNLLIYPSAAVLVLGRWMGSGLSGALNSLIAGLGCFGFFYLAAIVSPGGLGGGDIKLAALIGLLLGSPNVLWSIPLGVFAGGLTAIVRALAGRREPIPYAPFLCLAAVLAVVWDPLYVLLGL